MDFSGLEPGAQSAEFSRSQLRQRIEKTSSILGINFPIDKLRGDGDGLSTIGDDSSTVSGISTVVSSLFDKQGQTNPGSKKGISDALQEIKSTEPALRGEVKRVSSEMQVLACRSI